MIYVTTHRLTNNSEYLKVFNNIMVILFQLGVFKMSQSGLQGVLNPSEMFLADPHSDSDYLAGLAVAVIMDGSRAFLIEVQAMFLSNHIRCTVYMGFYLDLIGLCVTD